MTNFSNQDEMAELYGPLAPHSEHKIGDMIRYITSSSNGNEQTGREQTGRIIWVCAAGAVVEGHKPLPLRYVVQAEGSAWPDIVYPNEVQGQEQGQQEPERQPQPSMGETQPTTAGQARFNRFDYGTHITYQIVDDGQGQANLTPAQAYELLEWLYQQRDELARRYHEPETGA